MPSSFRLSHFVFACSHFVRLSLLDLVYHKFVVKELTCTFASFTAYSVFCLLMTLLVSSTSLCFAYQNVGISKYLCLSTAVHYQPSKKAASTATSLAEHEERVELAAVFYAVATVNLSFIFLFLVSMWIPFSCLSPKWNCVLSTLIPSFTVSFIARSA